MNNLEKVLSGGIKSGEIFVLSAQSENKSMFTNCVEQEEIWYVEVRDRVTHNIITDVCVGNDYNRAEMEKDQLDLAWDDGSTYTVITSEFEDC